MDGMNCRQGRHKRLSLCSEVDTALWRSAAENLLMEYKTTKRNRPLERPLWTHRSYLAISFCHLFEKLDCCISVVMVNSSIRLLFCQSFFFSSPAWTSCRYCCLRKDFVYNHSSLICKLYVNCCGNHILHLFLSFSMLPFGFQNKIHAYLLIKKHCCHNGSLAAFVLLLCIISTTRGHLNVELLPL